MANSFEQAAAANRAAADALLARDRAKRTAATRDPQADTFAQAADKARREGWRNTGGPTHRE